MRGALLLLLAGGCGGQTGEMPIGPDGPLVDFTQHVDDVAAVFGGSHPGLVEDAGRDRPCTLDGADFTLVSVVGDPSGCTDHDDATPNTCTRATEAYFALDGTIDFGDEAPIDFTGNIAIWSSEEGLRTFKDSLEDLDDDYAISVMMLLWEGILLDEARFVGLEWDRTLTADEDGDESTEWEVCTLAFTD